MSYKKWIIGNADREKASHVSEKLNIDPFISYLLAVRGIDDELAVSDFLSDSVRFVSPFSFTDMDKAVERINLALENGEKICIYGDYDCDGVTATALLYSYLESEGADVIYYIPDRFTDGYGLNNSAVDKIKAQNTDLIITVDNGIGAVEESKYIYSLGMELVVTDHHQPGDILPQAQAVVDPHRQDNDIPFRDYAGVGVAFKLVCALYGGDIGDIIEQYSDLVAIGTIGDIMSLKSENRSLVKFGLNKINNSTRLGISQLLSCTGMTSGDITADDVAYRLCPRINAAGRMDKALSALELLLSDDTEAAQLRARQLCDDNEYRHSVENNINESIKNTVEADPSLVSDRVIVVAGEKYHKGVIGISAARLADEYSKPAVVISIDEYGNATGSARSIEGFNIYEAVAACSDMLTHFGGHKLAAGLGLKAEDIPLFRKRINEYAAKNYEVMPVPSLKLDCKLSPFYLTTQLADNLTLLEPFGEGNEMPVFGIFNMTLNTVTPMGDGRHIRIEAMKKGGKFRIIKFRTSVDEFPYKPGDKLDFAVKVSKNNFKGRTYLSIQAVDIRKSGIDDNKYFAEKSDLQLFIRGKKNKTKIYPDRDACSLIYKFIRKNGGWNYTVDDLYFALGQKVTYAQLYYALDAFEEVGLIKRDGGIKLLRVDGKADLESSCVFKTLKGRL